MNYFGIDWAFWPGGGDSSPVAVFNKKIKKRNVLAGGIVYYVHSGIVFRYIIYRVYEYTGKGWINCARNHYNKDI
jgi:hypothetical protein